MHAGPSARDRPWTRGLVDPPDRATLKRVVVIGTSCSGKTTFARRLARGCEAPVVSLDVLFWRPNWTPSPDREFAAAIERATSGETWVVDGNYTRHQGLFWPRATTVIWLNYGFGTVMGRALRRTVGRMRSGEELFEGCRESFRQSFCSRESILLWVLRTFARNRRTIPPRLRRAEVAGIVVWEFRRPEDAERFLARLEPAGDR
jgi:adenylate kinase family enzyme